MVFKPLHCVFGDFVIAQRYVMVIMMQLAVWNAYHLRVVVNVAMAGMRNKTFVVSEEDCPELQLEHEEKILDKTYPWTNQEESYILAGFYVGYLISHVPGGWLADKLGARNVMGFSIASSSLATFFYPLCIDTGSLALAIFMRILIGVFQGPIYPCLSTFIQSWVPLKQRGFLGGIAYGGSNLGAITGNVFTGYIIAWTNSWKSPFYIWAVLGLIWYVFYLFMVFSEPQTHPFITKEEQEFLEEEIPKKLKKFKVPWKSILLSPVNYALIAGQFGHDYLFFTVLTNLPKYLVEVLKMNIKSSGVYTALPFFFIWLSSILSAYLADFVTNKELLSIITARRTWTAFSAIIPAVLLVLITYIGCYRAVASVLFSVLMFLHGPFYSGMKVNVNDITRNYGGVIMAIANGIGALGGVIGPGLIGHLTANHRLQEWRLVFWIMLGIMIVTTVIYWIFTSGDRQSWDYTEEETQE